MHSGSREAILNLLAIILFRIKIMTMNISSINKKIFFLPLYIFICLLLLLSSCTKEVSRSPVEPSPFNGGITVNSIPPGLTIFLNGRNTGRITPDSVTYLESGNYEIKLKKKYYRDTSITITLSEDEKKNVLIDYTSNPLMFGRISIFSTPPGAEIFINDSATTNITPDTLTNILPGEYVIRLKLINHRDLVFTAISESNKMNVYGETLKDTSEWIDYQVFNSGIQSNLLSFITVDNNNNKWIGTFDKGLIKYDEISFINYNTTNSGIPSNLINSIAASPSGEIWVATNTGAGKFDGSTWEIYNSHNSGLTSDIINSIEFDNNGIAWFGASSGLFRFDGTNWTRYNDAQITFWVSDTKIVSNNFIWVCTTEGGIRSISNDSITYYFQSYYNYPTNKITSVDVDGNGLAWFCHLKDYNQGRRSKLF